MNEFRTKQDNDSRDKDIVFSKAIKAGKRIYYLDVKQCRNEDYYIAITESKKKVSGFDEASQVISFEKHKIFLYKEDFAKFVNGLQEIIDYINEKNSLHPVSSAQKADEMSDI
jgi:hypothetical protein